MVGARQGLVALAGRPCRLCSCLTPAALFLLQTLSSQVQFGVGTAQQYGEADVKVRRGFMARGQESIMLHVARGAACTPGWHDVADPVSAPAAVPSLTACPPHVLLFPCRAGTLASRTCSAATSPRPMRATPTLRAPTCRRAPRQPRRTVPMPARQKAALVEAGSVSPLAQPAHSVGAGLAEA